jgi:TrbL/VirB6 plasmid conjugal transfer protein
MTSRRARWCAALVLPLVAVGVLTLRPAAAGAGPRLPAEEIECVNARNAPGRGVLPDWLADRLPDLVPDERRSVTVPDDPWMQWWRDEIRTENRGEGDAAGCSLADAVPQKSCAQRGTDAELSGLPPDGCWGTYPVEYYEPVWDSSDLFDPQFKDDAGGMIMNVAWWVGATSVKSSLWVVDFMSQFDIAQYSDLMTDVSEKYNDRIIGPWGLDDLVWLVLIGYVGYAILRGRMKVAGGELLMSMALLALATVLFTNRAMYMEEVGRTLDLASQELLVAANDPDDVGSSTPRHPCNRWSAAPDPDDASLGPMLCRIQQEFIERPYVYLNWGEDVDAACMEKIHNVVSVEYEGDGGWPSRYLERQQDKGICEGLDLEYYRDVGGGRIGTAVFAAIVQVAVSVFLALPAVTGVVATFMVAVLFAFTPFVLAVAALPGTGRRLAWSWAGAMMQAYLTALAMAFMISLLVLSVSSVLDRSQTFGLVHRWLLVLVVVGAVYYGRLHVMNVARAFSTRVADSLTRMSPAAATWQGGTSVGIDFTRADRPALLTAGAAAGAPALVAALTAGAAAGTAVLAGRSVQRRWVERRVAWRSLQNLELMERSREGLADEYRIDTYRYGDRRPGEPGQVRTFSGAAAGGVGGGGGFVRDGDLGPAALPPGGGFVDGPGPGGDGPPADAAGTGVFAPQGGGMPGGAAGGVGLGAGGAIGASGAEVRLPGGSGPTDGEFRIRHERVAKMRPAPYKPAWHVRARPWRLDARYYRENRASYNRHRQQVFGELRREETRFATYADKIDYFRHRGHPRTF